MSRNALWQNTAGPVAAADRRRGKSCCGLLSPRANARGYAGFTLLELLVVIALIGLLAALVWPALRAARDRAETARCASNLRQLFAANTLYAADHGHYVPAAQDMFGANRERWHGRRSSASQPFEGHRGPLAPYLGGGGEVRRCGALRYDPDSSNPFEQSCGGYGYNIRGVGSRAYFVASGAEAHRKGVRPAQIREPSRTVMFADAAFPQPYGRPTHLIEYSFAEAYYFVRVDSDGHVSETGRAMPSIHFRHGGKANVVWCDGRVTAEEMTVEGSSQFTEWNVGWFGGADNELFRPY